jgi:hypothetical protein
MPPASSYGMRKQHVYPKCRSVPNRLHGVKSQSKCNSSVFVTIYRQYYIRENALNSWLSIICCAVCGLQTCTGRYNVKVFCIVFIFCAFNDACGASGFIASTCKMIHEWCTWKALEWNDYRGCRGGELLWNTSISIDCLRDEVWKRDLPNTKKKYCPVNRKVDFKLRCYGHGTWSCISLIYPTPCVIINIS